MSDYLLLEFQLMWKGDAGKIVINATAYKLLQCHWHTPSEHTLNDTRLVNLNLSWMMNFVFSR